jgi:hypothetical protein
VDVVVVAPWRGRRALCGAAPQRQARYRAPGPLRLGRLSPAGQGPAVNFTRLPRPPSAGHSFVSDAVALGHYTQRRLASGSCHSEGQVTWSTRIITSRKEYYSIRVIRLRRTNMQRLITDGLRTGINHAVPKGMMSGVRLLSH